MTSGFVAITTGLYVIFETVTKVTFVYKVENSADMYESKQFLL